MESYTRKQEVVNGLIHGFGMLFGISAIPVLIAIATTNNNVPGIIGAGIYGFCFLMLFTTSTIFHIARDPTIRLIFIKLDHISIYFFIAGTYTPFLLVFLNNSFGISLLVILWSLSVIGVFIKIRWTGRYDVISTIVYLAMGWIMLVGGRKFFNAMPGDVLIFIILGGILYTVGSFFYLWDKYTYTHAVWHSFVLAAAICHYIAVLLTIGEHQPSDLKVSLQCPGWYYGATAKPAGGQSFHVGQNYRLGLYYQEFTQGLDKEVLLLKV